MTPEFAKFFEKWTEESNYYLVTGSDLEKVEEQIPLLYLQRAQGIFTCCGNIFYKNKLWKQERGNVRFKVPNLYKVTKIFGPPGTGKTHELLTILKDKLDYGYSKDDVLLVGYSRATAQNLKDRCKKDLNFTDDELEPIKTLHAMCKNALPKPEPSLLSRTDKEFFS